MSRVTSPAVGLCVVFTLLISLAPAPAQALSLLQEPPLDPPSVVLALAHYYVDAVHGSNVIGDGSQAAPWQTITHALGQVSGPDVEIHVAPGVYNSALGETFPIVMEPGISLLGSSYTATSLIAGGTGYVVHFPNTAVFTATTVISGFQIASGSTGVRVDGRTDAGQTPTIQANWITANTYGITNYATAYQRADPTIRGNLISANSAYGIYNYAGYLGTRVSPTIEDNQIVDNGGVGIYMFAKGASGSSYNSFSSPVIRDNLIARNHSHGLQCTSDYAGACGPLLSHNVIADNTGWGYTRSHSGTYLVTCQPKFVNDLVYGNSSGGVYAITSSGSYNDLPLFVNSTVVSNGSYGIRNGKPTIANTIVWGHTDNLNVATSYVSYSDIGDAEYGGINHNLSVDPQFVSPADDDYHLLPSSPVIDAGDSAYAGLPSTDMDGDLRILGPAVGMGADETAPYSVSIGKAVQPDTPAYPGDTLTYTLAVTNTGPGSAAGVLVTDIVPAGTSWNGVLQASSGSPDMDAGQVTWQGTMLLGHRETITFGVTTGQGLAWGEPITNVAVVANRTGSITQSLPVAVDAAPAAFWAASRQVVDDPYPVPGQRLVYTLLVSNTGNVSGTAVVTDTLDGNVTFAQAGAGGLPALGTVTWSGVGLAPGAHVALTLAVTVNVPLADGTPIGNAARVAGGPLPPFDLPPAGAVVYNPPVPDFNAVPRSGVSPLTVSFADASQRATSYLWSYGDSITGTTPGLHDHTYAEGGVYTVTLRVANLAAAAMLTRTHYITVAQGPEPNFEAAPLVGTAPLTVWFTNTSEHATEFLWGYGDGLTSTVTATLHTHTYAQTGTYSVTLTAVNDNGQGTATFPNYITVYHTVTAGFDGSPLIGLAPLTVQFTNSSSWATSYQWAFGDGTTSQESDPEHIYQAAGVYTVTLMAANPASQGVEVRPAYVTVQPVPQVAFEGQPLVGIAPLVVTFVNSTQDADWYLWSYGDGLTSTISAGTHTHMYTAPGFYDVTLTAGNAYATRSLLQPAYVAAYPPVTAAFDAAPCFGNGPLTVQFYNQSSGATSYLWTFGDDTSSAEFEPTHTYASPGLYQVTLQASNPADSDTLARDDYIVVCDPVLADFSGTPTFGVTPMIVTFANNAQYADTLLWDYGDGVTSTTTSQFHSHVYLDPGVFTVTLTATNACGADTLVRRGYVLAYAPPLPSDYYVDAVHGSDLIGAGTQEKPWRSITHALALVSGPDTRIHVAPGVYSTETGEVFPLVMEPGVSVLGAGYATTTLSGYSSQYVVLFPGATTYGTNTVLSGFKIEHGLAGVRVVGALGTGSTPTVENNWITDNSDGVRNMTDPSTRIYAVYRQNLIANNSVIGIRNQADATENCDDGFASPVIDGNQILNNGSAGISCYAYGWSKFDRGNCNPTITGNLIAGNGGSGFQTYAEYAGMISPQIVGNIIRDNARWGFEDDEGPSEYWTSNQPRLIGNLIYDNHLGGAVFFISDVGLSLNNTIVDNYAYGIQRIGPSYGYRSFPVTVVNNIVWGHTDDLKEVAPAYVSYSDIGEPGYGGLNNNISADPGFVNRPAGDYHILPSGPGVDAGDSDYPGVPATDIDGEQRIVGAAVDMGADEVPLYLGVNKTASPDPVISGGVITYTLYLSNGSNVALHAHVLDLLPDHVTPGGMLSWSPVLSTGQVWTETVRVTVEAGYVGPLINRLLATADEGASGQDQEISTVIDAPIAGLHATSDSPTPLGSATALTATVAAGTNVTFTWAFGDGQGGSGSTLSHLYAAPGLYTAVVTAANSTSAMTTTTAVTVQIAVAGLAAVNDSPTPLGSVTALTATLAAGTDVTFAWEFGDGQTGAGVTVTHAYRAPGVYTATVTAANDVSQATAWTLVAVQEPIAGLSAANNSPTPLGSATALTATLTAGTGVTFTWDLGDGTGASGAAITHLYPAVGIYTACVTAANDVGQATTWTLVTVQEPVAGLSAANDSPTVLGSVTALTATLAAGTGVTFTWEFGDGQTGAGATVAHTYPAPGVYTATVTAANDVSRAVTWTVAIVQGAVSGLQAANDSPTVLGGTTTLSATLAAGTGVTYTWDFGDGTGVLGTYTSGVLGLSIPDDGCHTGQYLEHLILVPAWGQILDLDVSIRDLRHGWDGDLYLSIVGPDGTTVALSSGRGGNGDDYYQTVLDDEAALPIGAGSPPFTGRFRPEEPLSAFDGRNQQGAWRLRVCDAGPSVAGVLNEWALDITTTAPGPALVRHTYLALGVYTATVTARNDVSLLAASTTVAVVPPHYLVYLPIVTKNK